MPVKFFELSTSSISIQHCGLNGSIPEVYIKDSNLITLNLNLNALIGSIPNSISNLPLQELQLGVNGFNGNIPDAIGDIKSLATLNLGTNSLSGTIPSSMQKLTGLQFLFLDSNHLTGEIPQWIGNFSLLKNLNLNSNQLNGSIPQSIANLPLLSTALFNVNQLSGELPLFNSNLITCDITFNAGLCHLTVPENDVCHYASTPICPANKNDCEIISSWLEYIPLSCCTSSRVKCSVTGRIISLNLRSSNISGSIPESLFLLGNLTDLYVLFNSVTCHSTI